MVHDVTEVLPRNDQFLVRGHMRDDATGHHTAVTRISPPGSGPSGTGSAQRVRCGRTTRALAWYRSDRNWGVWLNISVITPASLPEALLGTWDPPVGREAGPRGTSPCQTAKSAQPRVPGHAEGLKPRRGCRGMPRGSSHAEAAGP
jgi:hypothetical protein